MDGWDLCFGLELLNSGLGGAKDSWKDSDFEDELDAYFAGGG